MNGPLTAKAGVLTGSRFGGGPRPSIDTWLSAPGNKWAFRHARELFSSERVRSSPSPERFSTATDYEIDADLADYLDRSHTDALVILADGALVTQWYADDVRPDDRHMIFSCSKSVIGLVASVLVAEGRLDDKALVTAYVPEASVGGYADATVRNLLDMTADIGFVEDYDGPDVRRFRIASGQLNDPESMGIHQFTVNLPAEGAPGRRMRYASPTTDLAGWVCERATGRSLAELVSELVWEPMGAEWEADLLLDRCGAPRASGGLCVAARDMARLGQLLLREDLPAPLAEAVASVREPGDERAWDNGTLAGFSPGASYRSFWYQMPAESGVYLAAGIYGQRIYVDVPRRVVIAQQASLPFAYDETTWQETLPTFQRIARQAAGR